LLPPISLHVDDGVFTFSDQKTTIVSWEQFYEDVMLLQEVAQNPDCISTARYRLQVLEEKFHMYKLSNSEIEEGMDRYRRGGGIFADTTKVDNSIYLASSMHVLSLLEYIQTTFDREADEIVRLVGDRKEPQTLRRMFESFDLQDPSQLTVEGLGINPSSEKRSTRFDVTDPEFNRAGKSCAEILRLFLTRDTLQGGRYFAEAVRPSLHKNDVRTKYTQCRETVVEVLGLVEDEWDKLAKWLITNDLDELHRTNRWVVALPRQTIRKESTSEAFEFHQKHLENIFLPLFLATLAPEDPKNVDIAQFLQHVGAIMIVSDEEFRESDFQRKRRRPAEVPWNENVCDLYFAYYVWANLTVLNCFRRRKGLNTIQFRAVAGERSTQLDTLLYSFLLGDAVSHGLLLEGQPVLQYLYGAKRIGVCMSPLAHNGLNRPYMENPFPALFRRGIFVSLCTDQPLVFHTSQEPLLEEYGVAQRLYQLSATDMCEIAHNSVMISSFPDTSKAMWLGEAYIHDGVKGNSMELSNVPTNRLEFRVDMWAAEQAIILRSVSQSSPQQDSIFLHSRVPYLVTDPNIDFPRIVFSGPFERDSQHSVVAQLLHKALELRKSYVWGGRQQGAAKIRALMHQAENIENAFKRNDTFDEDEWMYKTVEGVVVPHEVHQIPRLPKDMFRYEDFRVHISEIRAITDSIQVKNFASRRLQLLEHKFKLHLAVNHSNEAGSTTEKASQNRDFYQATKVDTNVRMESGMTARMMLNFIVSKANNNGDDIVAQEQGKEPQTLRQLLFELDISPASLTVDDLNVQIHTDTGVSNQQFTPEGRDHLLTLLLKTDNQMKGRYFAELTKLTFDNFKRDKFTFAENRLPVYGASESEWNLLSDWFDTHGMASFNNQWMVQIPRIYGYLRKKGKVHNFAEYLEHIFHPLWGVSLHPSKNPRLFHFVNHISGFDCVEDEHKVDIPLNMATRAPQEWTSEDDPPYGYYMYHIWANIYSLNEFRQKRGFSTFSFRPSCGESGPMEHLMCGFLLANAINYGITLQDDPVLQYFFYLSQIGVSVCPLSNNTKVLDFLDNPFPHFFRRGLNVSLSTDGPLQFHHTQEPLLEEYSIASKVWKLSPNDMCEIARNSVIQSGFDWSFKQSRLGDLFFLSSSRSNDANRTHLSDIRVAYRYDTYHTELSLLEHVSGLRFERAMATTEEEEKRITEWNESQRQKQDVTLGGIIDAHQDEADIQKLNSQRAVMTKQMEELKKNVAELQRQNKQLSEKLAEESARDQAAQQLRRQQETQRLSSMAERESRSKTNDFTGPPPSTTSFEGDPSHSIEGSDEESELEDEEVGNMLDLGDERRQSLMWSGQLNSPKGVSPPASTSDLTAAAKMGTEVGGGIETAHYRQSFGRPSFVTESGGEAGLSRHRIQSVHELPSALMGTSSMRRAPRSAGSTVTSLVSANENLFSSRTFSDGVDGNVLGPTAPPRSMSSVPTSNVADALSEFLKKSAAELDRTVAARRGSERGVGLPGLPSQQRLRNEGPFTGTTLPPAPPTTTKAWIPQKPSN
jgi:AMP deaminase